MNDEKDYLKNLYQKLRRSIQEERMENLLLNDSQINYSPSYERNYIWNNTKAIKLIETILINGEVPLLTVPKINNTIEIIDGRQRYETLLKFYNDKLILRVFGLSFLKEL